MALYAGWLAGTSLKEGVDVWARALNGERFRDKRSAMDAHFGMVAIRGSSGKENPRLSLASTVDPHKTRILHNQIRASATVTMFGHMRYKTPGKTERTYIRFRIGFIQMPIIAHICHAFKKSLWNRAKIRLM